MVRFRGKNRGKKSPAVCIPSAIRAWQFWSINERSCLFTLGARRHRYCIPFSNYVIVITRVTLFDPARHPCKKHAEVKQAKRIQTRRPGVCQNEGLPTLACEGKHLPLYFSPFQHRSFSRFCSPAWLAFLPLVFLRGLAASSANKRATVG